ncbi:hypothetical protein CFK37_10535 [Virgibacillus phasianinus]|uniref:Uncharacterized protein n=1 Tax=Virgibacillus phasianinus TaxID=2017483 RepID=A0A220U4A1_9BACI|nr:hypothetical protein [Virgibacillus phasianinus]ASK62553.1 hypothetical protein CFK37_10535 [Virgibacillus phasianinus]
MSKIEAYYRTENDAESAKAKLETFKVGDVIIERVPDASRNGFIEQMKNIFADVDASEQHDPQILQADIAEEDFAEANRIVQESEGYFSDK